MLDRLLWCPDFSPLVDIGDPSRDRILQIETDGRIAQVSSLVGCAQVVLHGSLDPVDREAEDGLGILDDADDVDRVLADGCAVDGFDQPQGRGGAF